MPPAFPAAQPPVTCFRRKEASFTITAKGPRSARAFARGSAAVLVRDFHPIPLFKTRMRVLPDRQGRACCHKSRIGIQFLSIIARFLSVVNPKSHPQRSSALPEALPALQVSSRFLLLCVSIIVIYQCYKKRIFLFSPSCILHQLPCIAGRMPGIGDEVIYMIHNIAVCSHDCDLTRNTFHPWRIEGTVKSIWR